MSRGKAVSRAGILVRYRLVGGPVSADQRLTVFEDGTVKLDERHRTRDSIWLRLDATELDRLRVALHRVPAPLWSRGPRLAMARAKSALINLGSLNDFETLGSHFELRRGRRAIAGADPTAEDFRVEVVVTLLDSLRVHAVRAEPR